jgi:hypothetical protein
MIRKQILGSTLVILLLANSAHGVMIGGVSGAAVGIQNQGTKITVKDSMNRIIGYKKLMGNETRFFDSSNRYLGKCEIKDKKEVCYDSSNRRVNSIEFPK